jgi:8-oxo-dGTP pyrophosphatase MutT (NUDIX family)
LTDPSIRVLAAVVRDGERHLVCLRPAHKRHGGLWEFPGGKVESGESDFSALSRELREELDVELVQVGRELFAVHDEGSPFLIAFIEATIDGTPACHEHSAHRWAPMAKLVELPLAPSDRLFVEHVLSLEDQRNA